MTDKTERRANRGGLRKRCGCSSTKWSKCAHSWHFNFKLSAKQAKKAGVPAGVSVRKNLDELADHPITNKEEAVAEAERLKTAFRNGELIATQVPVLDANGDPVVNAKGKPLHRVDISTRRRPTREIITLAQLLAAYVKEYVTLERPLSLGNVTYQVGAISATVLELPTGERRTFGDWHWRDVGTGALEKFRAARRTQTIVKATDQDGQERARRKGGVPTTNRDLGLLRAMFNWAIRVDYVDTTPFKKSTETVVKLTKESTRRRRLDGNECERLLKACDPLLMNPNPKVKAPLFPQPPARLRPIVEAAIETGCRRGELLSLQWWQVKDLNGGTPRLDLPAAKTKTKRDRVVPISGRLKGILEMRRNDPAGEPHGPQAYVFGDEIGRRIRSIKTAWRLTCRRAQIADLHFHDLRREAGSRWLEGGVPLQIVREWLGHANISQTSTYLESTLTGQHEAMRRFETARALESVAHQQRLAAENNVQPGATAGGTSPVSDRTSAPSARKNENSQQTVN
jgi:integrase